MLVGGGHGGNEPNGEERAHFGGNDIGWQAFGPSVAFTLLASLVVAARWFTRHRLAQCVGLDDYVILLSLVRGQWISDMPTMRADKQSDPIIGNGSSHRRRSQWR